MLGGLRARPNEIKAWSSRPNWKNCSLWLCNVHCWNATQYYSTETVLLIFPFLQTNITVQMRPSGGYGATQTEKKTTAWWQRHVCEQLLLTIVINASVLHFTYNTHVPQSTTLIICLYIRPLCNKQPHTVTVSVTLLVIATHLSTKCRKILLCICFQRHQSVMNIGGPKLPSLPFPSTPFPLPFPSTFSPPLPLEVGPFECS